MMFKDVLFRRSTLVIIAFVALFACTSWFSLEAIMQLQGNARVINYIGIVRGATQRLVKKEIYGQPDHGLEDRLDSIVTNLLTGKGPNNLIALPDRNFMEYMHQVEEKWEELKREIFLVRQGENHEKIYSLSEDYFTLVDQTVSAAEAYTETQVDRTRSVLLTVNGIFILAMLGWFVFFLRTTALKRRSEMLGKIAYVDVLTQMPNRASCEKLINEYKENPPEGQTGVFLADMNSLKQVNDQLGHQGGDRIIADFARVLKSEAEPYGYVCRFGGDEFVGIFTNCTENKFEEYFMKVNEKIVSYNLLHVSDIEKISFAVGCFIDDLKNISPEEMINEADRRMYLRKRQMKENL